MKIEEFQLERNQSLFENTVSYNLTESGIHPCALKDFLSDEEQREVLGLELGYGQTNGDPALRDAIAAMYPRYNRDNVLVTNGSAEANFVAIWSLLGAGDQIAMMLPNYMLVWGLARSFGVDVKPFHLREERNWGIDMAELESAGHRQHEDDRDLQSEQSDRRRHERGGHGSQVVPASRTKRARSYRIR